VGILIAVIVAVVAFWLLLHVLPTFLAALIALVLFLAFVGVPRYHSRGPRDPMV
jgi:uncharacterized membrane protein YccC